MSDGDADPANNRHLGQPYSAANPIPKIVTSVKGLIDPKHATEEKAAELQTSNEQNEQNDAEKRARKMAKGHVMRVTDPTTGEQVEIKNTEEEVDTSNHGQNVLETEYPPPDWRQFREQAVAVTTRQALTIGAAFALSTLFFHTVPLPYISSRPFLLGLISVLPPSLITYATVFRLRKAVEFDWDAHVWHAERRRGMTAGSDTDGDGNVSQEERTKESAEWVNTLLRGLWPIINPDMFTGMVDMLEDIMQQSVPSFVDMIKVADLGLGSTAMRITSIRSLPDAEHDAPIDALGEEERDQLDGDHINVEVSFAFKALPSGNTASSKAHNPHLLIEFFTGIKGIWAAPVPVWVELTGAIGTMRARIQLIPDPPFIKTSLVTLMGLPRIDISVIALSKAMPNIMNLPFISGFISSAINTAAAEYVAPKSLTLNLQQLLAGDDIKKDTEAIGVLVVHIHRAMNIKKTDTVGYAADPYITLTYSRLGKPLYSTRIIKGDQNPVFEETAVLLVDANTVKLKEQLSFQLWDSDRLSVDDMMGIVDVDIIELMTEKNTPARRISHLRSPDSEHRPGSVEYTVGYYGKAVPNAALKTDGADPGIPEQFKDTEEFRQARATALNDLEAAVLVTPPDPEWPSGILSVQVHEIRDLAVKRVGREKKGKLEGQKGATEGEETSEEGEGLPSSYCTISINDELMYETRVKPITSTPTFNAGTERFVRDWRTAHVTVAVKDARKREDDTILGLVFLKVSELLANASEITRVYSLEEGLGTGRVRVSLLFRPVEAKLPPNLLGFDTGMLEVRDLTLKSDDEALSKCEIQLRTNTATDMEKISRHNAERTTEGHTVWHIDGEEARVPVRQRYGAALGVSFKHINAVHHKSQQGLAVLWLRDIVDNEERTVEVPVWSTDDDDAYGLLTRNYSPPDGDLAFWDDDKSKLRRVGTLALDCVFRPGMDLAGHKKQLMASGHAKKKGSYDLLKREQAAGLRDNVGNFADGNPRPGEETASPGDAKHSEFAPPAKPQEEGTAAERPLGDAEEASYRLGEDGGSGGEANTEVGPEDVDDRVTEEEKEGDGAQGSGSDDDGDGDDHKKRSSLNLVGKFKDWKDHQKELHSDHRGAMQAKPVRTATWIKDNVEESAIGVKNRFKMHERKPDVETEV